jgi:DNA polymerase-4
LEQPRKIIHVDMDAFYASVEQRDFPEYRGQPVIVGGAPDSRGVVATCSYEARKFGIHSAMPSAHAYRLCPDAVFLRPRFDTYRQVSHLIQAIFRRYTERVEPLSLDEAYLDVTESTHHQGSATLLAREIKSRVRADTDLTASAGVSYNKFLAKLASDLEKPDGLTLIGPADGAAFVAKLPIGRFHGVGKATEKRMLEAGIRTGADLRTRSMLELQRLFGKSAHYYYNAARGIDDRPVESERPRKSIGAENTFQSDLDDLYEMRQQIAALTEDVCISLESKRLAARTVTLKVKYRDFQLITRSQSLPRPVSTIGDFMPVLETLLDRTDAGQRAVRLLGVTASNLVSTDQMPIVRQLDLFLD